MDYLDLKFQRNIVINRDIVFDENLEESIEISPVKRPPVELRDFFIIIMVFGHSTHMVSGHPTHTVQVFDCIPPPTVHIL